MEKKQTPVEVPGKVKPENKFTKSLKELDLKIQQMRDINLLNTLNSSV
jgi:hypothetical protein